MDHRRLLDNRGADSASTKTDHPAAVIMDVMTDLPRFNQLNWENAILDLVSIGSFRGINKDLRE
jgi:hypothetical protein